LPLPSRLSEAKTWLASNPLLSPAPALVGATPPWGGVVWPAGRRAGDDEAFGTDSATPSQQTHPPPPRAHIRHGAEKGGTMVRQCDC
jgi:hypothetical protein